MTVITRDWLLFVQSHIRLIIQRLAGKIVFVSPDATSVQNLRCVLKIAENEIPMPRQYLRLSRSFRNLRKARFREEKVYCYSPAKDAPINDARLIEIASHRFLDVGNQSRNRWKTTGRAYSAATTVVRTAVILPWGTGGASYGDFLIQVLPKIVRILNAVPETERNNLTLCLPFFSEQKWAWDYLSLMGFRREQLESGDSRIIVPSGGRIFLGSGPKTRYGISNPEDIEGLLRCMAGRIPAVLDPPYRKLYISRRTGRKMAAEETLLDGLASRGFEIVCLEDLTVPQQIRLFQEASIVVGPHGAGHANIMWSQPGSTLVEIFNPAWMHPCYALLAEMKKINYHCLVGASGAEHGRWTNFSYFGIFENPTIDAKALFEKIDTLL